MHCCLSPISASPLTDFATEQCYDSPTIWNSTISVMLVSPKANKTPWKNLVLPVVRKQITVWLLKAGQFGENFLGFLRGLRLLVSNFIGELLSVCFNAIGRSTKKVAIFCSQLTFWLVTFLQTGPFSWQQEKIIMASYLNRLHTWTGFILFWAFEIPWPFKF